MKVGSRRSGHASSAVLLAAVSLIVVATGCGAGDGNGLGRPPVTTSPVGVTATSQPLSTTTVSQASTTAVSQAPATAVIPTVSTTTPTVAAASAMTVIPASTTTTVTPGSTTTTVAAAPVATAQVVPVAVVEQSAALDQLPTSHTIAPVRLRIEGQTIDAPVVAVSADPTTSELAVPPVHDTIGWYQYGPTPGEPGSAVMAAHVDWNGQLGVFFTLNKVPVGATVVVTLEDGSERQFSVTRREQIAKIDLPVQELFAKTGPAQLVLVTCGGSFNRSTHHYADNFILIATPIGTSTT